MGVVLNALAGIVFPLRDDAFLKIKNINGWLEISSLVRFLYNNSNFGRPVIQRGKCDPAEKKTLTWVWAEWTCSEASLWWESQRTRRLAGSEPSLALPQLAEGAWVRVEVLVRRGWISGVMRWARWLMKWELPWCRCIDPLMSRSQWGRQLPDLSPPPPVNNLLRAGDADAANGVITPIARRFDSRASASWKNILLDPLLLRLRRSSILKTLEPTGVKGGPNLPEETSSRILPTVCFYKQTSPPGRFQEIHFMAEKIDLTLLSGSNYFVLFQKK